MKNKLMRKKYISLMAQKFNGFPMDWPLQVGESEENKEQSKGWKRSPTTRVKAACWKNLHTYQMGGESRPYPKQSGDTKVPQRGGARTRAAKERSQRAGFLAIESDGPADLTLKLLILAGDVETNPGPKKRTVRDRPTKNLLMGDSIIKPIENNESWNVRAVHGGTPEDLRDWLLNEPDMLNGADNIAILIGGNSVCSKRNRKPIADPEWTTEQIFGLVADLKRANVASIKVLGVPKRSCKKDMKERDQASTSDGTPPTKKAKNNLPKKKEACKPGENNSISEINDVLRESGDKYGYKFVGVGNELASESCFSEDGVHLSRTGACHLAKILRKSCL